MKSNKYKLSEEATAVLLDLLKVRFEKNVQRHEGIAWADVVARLEANEDKLWSLNELERTGGEPDVVGADKETGEFLFYDCAAESPKGRRSLCFDREGLASRKEHLPESTVLDMAKEMGVTLLNEAEYRTLQQLGAFDLKTSSWIVTPDYIRKLGGALFADRRYDAVFVYHNGAQSYYSTRGFRGSVRV